MHRTKRSEEVESKFELTEEAFDRLRNIGRELSCDEQLNVYYDADGRLAESAITLRVRYSRGRSPLITLKIPSARNGEARCSEEIQAECVKWIPVRSLAVDRDLPKEFASPLWDRGIKVVHRLGSMRNTRWVVALSEGVEIELDRVGLPGGRVFFEVEVEEREDEKRTRTVEILRRHASGARPSLISKFERFVQSLNSSAADSIDAERGIKAHESLGEFVTGGRAPDSPER